MVVLDRAGWGDSKWTRVEQTEIRARGFALGYLFAKFIPLDEPAAVPPWLPPSQSYIGLNRFGVDGAAAVRHSSGMRASGPPSRRSSIEGTRSLARPNA